MSENLEDWKLVIGRKTSWVKEKELEASYNVSECENMEPTTDPATGTKN